VQRRNNLYLNSILKKRKQLFSLFLCSYNGSFSIILGSKLLFMGDLFAGQHMLLILIIVLLFFGGKKLPELMRGLGRGIREFKDAKDNVKREIETNMNDEPNSSKNNSSSSN